MCMKTLEIFLYNPAPAQIVIRPNNLTQVNSGDTLTVGCVAYGDPLPHLSWRKDGVELANGSQIQIYEERVTESGITFIKSILEICSASEADIGQYSCTANNTLGFETAEFELQVNTEGRFLYCDSTGTWECEVQYDSSFLPVELCSFTEIHCFYENTGFNCTAPVKGILIL